MSAHDPKGLSGSALASGGVATFAGEGDNLEREDCNTLSYTSELQRRLDRMSGHHSK